MEELNIVPLTESNLRSVFEMCEENVLFYSFSFDTFKRATLMDEDYNPELSIVAVDEEDNPIAFFFAVFRRSILLKSRNKLIIKMFIVEKNCRYQGIGTKMMNELLKRAKQQKNSVWRMKVSIMDSNPRYWLPGLDPRHTEAYFFLRKLGFKKNFFERFRTDLEVDKRDFPKEEPLKEINGYKISRALQKDKEETVAFIKKHFGKGTWPEETLISFENDPSTTFIVRDINNYKLVGFATHSAQHPGSFGPTGVLRNLRGKGIGGLLLKWCLWDIKQMGIDKCIIKWVACRTKYFYLKSAKARIFQIFWPMSRRI
ncbi:MAG: GNAT family N-acetyltransferase [Candidatus Lokiarchaeota archaeon]|nr:GNAT family N-acetyltransferase [Candidatus Lokiarchaeota archaeon]